MKLKQLLEDKKDIKNWIKKLNELYKSIKYYEIKGNDIEIVVVSNKFSFPKIYLMKNAMKAKSFDELHKIFIDDVGKHLFI